MSNVLNLPGNGMFQNIYVIYNFKQVNDEILLVMYNDKYKSWQKIFVDYNNGSWQTNTLAEYTNAETYHKICDSLKKVFNQHKYLYGQNFFYTDKLLPEHAAMMLSACS